MNGWKGQLLSQAIRPVQQLAYMYDKNTTDSAMTIDAMDLLYARCFNSPCLGNFTRRRCVSVRLSSLWMGLGSAKHLARGALQHD